MKTTTEQPKDVANAENVSGSAATPCYPAGSVGGTLHKMMTDNGLWPQEADAVLESVRTDKHAEALAEVLGRTWDGYHTQFHAVAWLTVKGMVVEYIDANKPQHFARPMFAG